MSHDRLLNGQLAGSVLGHMAISSMSTAKVCSHLADCLHPIMWVVDSQFCGHISSAEQDAI